MAGMTQDCHVGLGCGDTHRRSQSVYCLVFLCINKTRLKQSCRAFGGHIVDGKRADHSSDAHGEGYYRLIVPMAASGPNWRRLNQPSSPCLLLPTLPRYQVSKFGAEENAEFSTDGGVQTKIGQHEKRKEKKNLALNALLFFPKNYPLICFLFFENENFSSLFRSRTVTSRVTLKKEQH